MTKWSAALKKKAGREILVGDLNIAPLESDVWSHKKLLDVVSHTPIETEGLLKMMAARGWVDAVRHFVPPAETLFSWWRSDEQTSELQSLMSTSYAVFCLKKKNRVS